MKCPVLLCLFLPMMQSYSVPDHSGNVTLEPATTLGTSKQRHESVLSTTMIPLDNESTDPILDSFDYDFEVEDLDTPETHYIRIFLKEQSGLKNITKRISDEVWMSQRPFHFLKAVNGLFVENINCVLFATQLNCTWKILNPPIDAQYSVTIQQEDSTTICDCDQKDGKVIGCHGIFKEDPANTLININVSCSNFSYIHSWVYDKSLEKFQPPQNISASIKSGKLHIKWDPPKKLSNTCFCYELAIKWGEQNKTEELSGEVELIVPDIDLTKSYSVQMRVKMRNSCLKTIFGVTGAHLLRCHRLKSPLS
ncbi:hypothetical protein AGOR_G00063610 [Albula goreensis]|uniref:Leptin receptor n=1 Tax=Albula goreensis TaxID=1534307 RepID=A0A8T3DZ76_9TELE|nr:hypothetical protein AGOR_G00063610 [Albula goreensis]